MESEVINMSKYIDTDELIFIGLDNPDCEHLFEFVPKEFIDNMPPADVRENVHGEWIDTSGKDHYKCSVCNILAPFCFEEIDGEWRSEAVEWLADFCPNCGADMREGKPK